MPRDQIPSIDTFIGADGTSFGIKKKLWMKNNRSENIEERRKKRGKKRGRERGKQFD